MSSSSIQMSSPTPFHTQLARRLADNGRFRWMRRLGYWWLRPSKSAWEAAFDAAFALEYPREKEFFGESLEDKSENISALIRLRENYFRHKETIRRTWWAVRPSGFWDCSLERLALMEVIGLQCRPTPLALRRRGSAFSQAMQVFQDVVSGRYRARSALYELAHAGQELYLLYRGEEHSAEENAIYRRPHW